MNLLRDSVKQYSSQIQVEQTLNLGWKSETFSFLPFSVSQFQQCQINLKFFKINFS